MWLIHNLGECFFAPLDLTDVSVNDYNKQCHQKTDLEQTFAVCVSKRICEHLDGQPLSDVQDVNFMYDLCEDLEVEELVLLTEYVDVSTSEYEGCYFGSCAFQDFHQVPAVVVYHENDLTMMRMFEELVPDQTCFDLKQIHNLLWMGGLTCPGTTQTKMAECY